MSVACRGRGLSRGVTLVELVVSTIIMAFLVAIVFRVMGRLNQSVEPTLSDRLVVNLEGVQAANVITDHIQECLEVIRPTIGETLSHLVLKNTFNELNLLALEPDEEHSSIAQKPLFKLVSFTRTGAPEGDRQVLFDSIRRLTFTCASPNQIQVNLVLSNRKGEFAVVAQVGLLTFGGPE